MKTEPKSSHAETPGLLSAMLDGEATQAEIDAACAAWRDDADSRDRWHAYALIGDVLRSEDLGHAADRDATFVRALSERLVAEPAPMNPAPSRRLWRQIAVPAAVAAGFAAVASAVIVMRGPPEREAAAIASADAGVPPNGNAARVRWADPYVDAHRVQSIRRASLAQAVSEYGR